MEKSALLLAVILGLINLAITLSERLANFELLGVALGYWFFLLRYVWRFIVLIAVWSEYAYWLRFPGVLPVLLSYGYELYLIATFDKERTSLSFFQRLPKMLLFTVVPFVQAVFLLRSHL